MRMHFNKNLAHFLLSQIIYWTVILPIWFVYPTKKGTDPTQYPLWVDVYVTLLAIGFFILWSWMSTKIAKAIMQSKLVTNLKRKMSDFKTYTPNQRFTLELLNEDKDEVYEILGITEERSDEIAALVDKYYRTEQYFSDTLKAVVADMEHINEVVFATLVAARRHSKNHKSGGGAEDLHKQMEVLSQLIKLQKGL